MMKKDRERDNSADVGTGFGQSGDGNGNVIPDNAAICVSGIINQKHITIVASHDGRALSKCAGNGIACVVKNDVEGVANGESRPGGDNEIATGDAESSRDFELIVAGAGCRVVNIDIEIRAQAEGHRAGVENGYASGAACARGKI